MQTIERTDSGPVADEQIHTPKNRNRTFVFLSAILAVAVLVMGAIMIFGDDGGQSLTPEQEQMLETIDQYYAAVNEGDIAAAVSLVAPSGYRQKGSEKSFVADGSLEADFDAAYRFGFTARRTDAVFVDDVYVITTDHVPANSEDLRVSMYRMNPAGNMIMWQYVPGR